MSRKIKDNSHKIQYAYKDSNLNDSEPSYYDESKLERQEMVINLGPQHPSTHGVLRLEVLMEGEYIKEVIPHLGYLHRCFEKHAENLPYNQIIPFVDRMDYVAAMNSEHTYAMAVEKMLGIDKDIPKRVEYIRVLVAELNRLASHFVAIGTYALDIGAVSPLLWMMRDREHILRMLEWICGGRMLYNYIWVGGLFYDLPIGFEDKCEEFVRYIKPKLAEIDSVLIDNKIFKQRTGNIGVLPIDLAVNYGASGPVLRGSGLKFDLRKVDGYSVYPELDFDVPIGEGIAGSVGDCFDRNWVRVKECQESLRIIEQCLLRLKGDLKRTKEFDPREKVPKKIRPAEQEIYFRAENPRGELGFMIKADGRSDIPVRCKARSSCFVNLSLINDLAQGELLADLIAIIGSIDIVLGEVDR